MEEPKDEEPKQEELEEEEPKQEEIKDEEPKQEELKDEEPKQEDLKDEEPKQEELKDEEPKQEELKDEELKDEEVKDEELKDEDAKQKARKPKKETKMEKTLAIIKPNAMPKAEEIEKIIIKEGFTIIQRRRVQLSKEQAMEFYSEHRDKSFFSNLINFVTSGPVLAMVLGKQNGIRAWRRLLGPTRVAVAVKNHPKSIRALYGDSDTENAAHGSDSLASAEREIRFFFPDVSLDPLLTGVEARDYLDELVSPTLVRGLTELCQAKPADPITWLADWLLVNNPQKPVVGGDK